MLEQIFLNALISIYKFNINKKKKTIIIIIYSIHIYNNK